MVLFLFVLMILMLNEDELQGKKSKLVVFFIFVFYSLTNHDGWTISYSACTL